MNDNADNLTHCAYCGDMCQRRTNEDATSWANRKFCSPRCAVKGRNRDSQRDAENMRRVQLKALCVRWHGQECGCWTSGQITPHKDTCHIDDCSAPVKGHGLCPMHYMRWTKYGDPYWSAYHDDNLKVAISYSNAHQRVARKRGPASSHLCVDCGGTACDWSYIGDCPQEQHDDRHGSPYSPDPSRYEPRCRPCHKAFDLQQNAQTEASR